MEVEQEMKNFRKLLSLVCMLVLAMSLCTTAFAALTADARWNIWWNSILLQGC